MKKDTIDNLFDRLKGEFDIASPASGHQDRFLNKLKAPKHVAVKSSGSSGPFWKPLLAVAAIIVMCLCLFTLMQQEPELKGLASVSPEFSKTQDFFTVAIQNELASLNAERTPETKVMVDDALKQLDLLEKDYEKLKVDLTESGDDKRVIYAMISNFQNRIEVLQTVLENIKNVKRLNKSSEINSV